ncbi:MAG TPA: peptidoglycan-binding domain-containing protein [Polyangiaceae bacterium]|nr:peptidoglycan-binding domain-containing protein [Polyangiaceae bacterium]
MSDTIHESEKFGRIDVATTEGVQQALSFLGHDPGAVDGLDGPNTHAALKAFQEAVGITSDGLIGPNSRKALLSELESAAAKQDDPPPADNSGQS